MWHGEDGVLNNQAELIPIHPFFAQAHAYSSLKCRSNISFSINPLDLSHLQLLMLSKTFSRNLETYIARFIVKTSDCFYKRKKKNINHYKQSLSLSHHLCTPSIYQNAYFPLGWIRFPWLL